MKVHLYMNTLTPTGRAWCTAALDPFHDFPFQLQGFPDGTCSPSFTRIHNQTLSFGAAETGDVIRICFDGLHKTALNRHKCQFGLTDPYDLLELDEGLVAPTGPLTVIRALSPSLAAFDGTCSLKALEPNVDGNHATLLGTLALTPDLTTPSRVIAIGLEVHDTTPPIHRSGSISCVHIPGQTQSDDSRVVLAQYVAATESSLKKGVSATAAVQIFTNLPHVTLTPALPSRESVASLVPGFLTWESAKGVYLSGQMVRSPVPRHFMTTPLQSLGAAPSQTNFGIVTESSTSGPCETWAVPFALPAEPEDPPSINQYTRAFLQGTYPSFDSGFQPFQVWLSGLSNESTFKVVLRTVVEYFPEVTDPAALANAIVPAPFDPQALYEYHRARSALPAGVPVGLNQKGDWWRMVLKTMGKSASLFSYGVEPMLRAAGQPHLATLASIGMPALRNMISQAIEQSPKKKKKQILSVSVSRKKS